MRFRSYFEATDIFGFETRSQEKLLYDDDQERNPLHQFDVDLMVEYLSLKRVGILSPQVNFMNEIQWGEQAGAVKLEIEPRMSFVVKRLGFDRQGQGRWITKKYFQLNRLGYGGYEDSVANEIYNILDQVVQNPLEAARDDYEGLENLTQAVCSKMRRVAKPLFIYEGIRRLSPENFLIVFGVRGQGVEAPNHQRMEENLTQLTYDKKSGTIRITNYKVESNVGGPHSWKVKPSDLDLYFFTSQDKDEIAECVATFFKYY